MAETATRYYSGTSGLLLPVRNKLFYPPEFKDKSRLTFYSSLMNSIEVNSSFYKVPMASTVQKWANEVTDDFRFSFKLSRDLTHNKSLAFDEEAVRKFMEVISFAKTKKGCLLVQFPPSVRINHLKQLARLLDCISAYNKVDQWEVAVEVRHVSLYHEEVYSLLAAYHMGMVIQDKPPAITPMCESDLPFVYLRFHGPEGSYKGSYDDELLAAYASYIQGWIQEGKTVYTYFNNTIGEAIANLFSLRDKVLHEV